MLIRRRPLGSPWPSLRLATAERGTDRPVSARLSRREFNLLVATGALGAALGSCGAPAARHALRTRVLAELEVFTSWLRRTGSQGYIGEVGWPDDQRGDARAWNALARDWYGAADKSQLWVTAWAAGEWWPPYYQLACYRSLPGAAALSVADTQASVIETHPTTQLVRRGVNVAGGAFGASLDPTSSFSNATPGVIDRQYHFDGPESFAFLASRGVKLVRVEFRWERLQPVLGAELAAAELARLRAVVARVRAVGLDAVLDMHNYGAYYAAAGGRGVRQPLGSPVLGFPLFADAWSRISAAFSHDPGVLAYGLMNEPTAMPAIGRDRPAKVWERASQAALDSIRAQGDQRLIMVGGYDYSGVQGWAANHPRAWIHDPANNTRYEAHHYWDLDHSSAYTVRFALEDRKLAQR